jgi:hypothetical protein
MPFPGILIGDAAHFISIVDVTEAGSRLVLQRVRSTWYIPSITRIYPCYKTAASPLQRSCCRRHRHFNMD